MNKQSLTELEILNEKIKDEKTKVYSNGIAFLPAITGLTCGALATNNFGIAIGSLIMISGLVATGEILVQKQKIDEEKVKTYKKIGGTNE